MKFLPVLLLVLSATFVISQNPAPSNPQTPAPPAAPTQQQQVMEYFVGNWSLQGTTKISPTSPPAEFTGKEQSAWTPGGYFVETHTDVHGPLGDVRSTRVMEYNPTSHLYLYNVYNSLGEHIVAMGHVSGNSWTWKAQEKLNGVIVPTRYIFTFDSKDSYSFKQETQPNPKGEWVTVMQGTATRMQ